MMGNADARAGGARRGPLWVALAVSGFVCVLLGLVAPARLAVARGSAPSTSAPAAWAQGWAMVGHDPQQTGRSLSTVRLHPRLIFTYTDDACGTPLVDGAGRIYAWCGKGLTALTMTGRRRWRVALSQIEGGPPALAPNGLVLVNANDGMTTYRHLFIIGLVAATGQQRWIAHSLPWASALGADVPNSKGAAPLVTAANLLYVPFVGPSPYHGIGVFGPTGQPLQHLFPHAPPTAMAAARDGTVYAISGNELVALAPDGAVRWQHPSYANAVLIGMQGTIYTADGTNGVGAYAPSGRLLWHCTTGDDVMSLAERADGTVLALGRTELSAVSPAGHRLWRRPVGRQVRTPSAQPPTIAIDAAGRAYLGSNDGMVRVIAPDGSLLWTLSAGGPTSLGNTPSISLGPAGTLVVTRTDGRLSVYQ